MQKAKLIYVNDALCSWCYAFNPALQKTIAHFPNMELQVVSGGMVIGERRRNIQDAFDRTKVNRESVRNGYKNLISHGKANISDKYFDLFVRDYYMDSEKPAIALSVFRSHIQDPVEALKFVHALQTQMYVHGVDPNSEEYYSTVVTQFGLNAEQFLQQMTQPKFKDEAKRDFKFARDLGVNSYPQLFLQTADDNYYLLSKGYSQFEKIKSRIESILAIEHTLVNT